MVYMPLEGLLPKAGFNTYKLSMMAARRALDIASGSPKLVRAPGSQKLATIALREIQAGKVVLKDVADQFKPIAKK